MTIEMKESMNSELIGVNFYEKYTKNKHDKIKEKYPSVSIRIRVGSVALVCLTPSRSQRLCPETLEWASIYKTIMKSLIRKN